MLIVIAIIAILVGITLPQYDKYIRSSKATTIIYMIEELKNAEIIYKAVNSRYLIFSAAGNNSNLNKLIPFKKLDLDTPKDNYDYYVWECNGTIPGIIIKIRKIGGKFIYHIIPSDMMLNSTSDKSLISHGYFKYDYINDVYSHKEPRCP